MKRYEIYKNIRKRAIIFGLPISLFALMMSSIIVSLLIIIFSFSFIVVIGILICNATLYIALTKFAHNPQLLQVARVFPKIISNKKSSVYHYE